MNKNQPVFDSITKLNNENATEVKLALKTTVTYFIKTKSSKKLSIPYAVAIDNEIQNELKLKPSILNTATGKILVRNVLPGQKICLFLNSDAHPDYRKNPVYSITSSNRNAIVCIEEKLGKNDSDDRVSKVEEKSSEIIDHYTANLTGDVWMKISHKYSPEEAAEILSKESNLEIVKAVTQIYQILSSPRLYIDNSNMQKNPRDRRRITVTFNDSDNCKNNISSGYHLFREGLTRVHPAGYAAIFQAAIQAGVGEIVISSTWRPLMGSIAHRAGLGIDIAVLDEIKLDRQELLKNTAVDTANVSTEEKRLFSVYESEKDRVVELQKSIRQANHDEKNARQSPKDLAIARQKVKKYGDDLQIAKDKQKDSHIEWIAERDKNEPLIIRKFRLELVKSHSIAQLFDPWVIDHDTRDKIPAIPNYQFNDNEKLHAHHLHITIVEPKIYE